MYACICHAVPMADVVACIDNGAHDEESVGQVTGALALFASAYAAQRAAALDPVEALTR